MQQARTVKNARSFLFVPGNRPERFSKAIMSGSDAVIFDLEDAVPATQKNEARQVVHTSLPDLAKLGSLLVVRINTSTSPEGLEDLRALAGLQGLAAVMVPKAEDEAALAAVSYTLPGVAVIPLIESTRGYLRLNRLADTPGVVRLAFGNVDFSADSGIQYSEDERELDTLRFAISMHSQYNKLAPPIDGVTLDIHSPERLTKDTERALRFGFGAKLCIHPKQVEVIHTAMRPTVAELAWAREVITADLNSGGAAVQLNGRMVDAPVVLQAKRILARVSSAA